MSSRLTAEPRPVLRPGMPKSETTWDRHQEEQRRDYIRQVLERIPAEKRAAVVAAARLRVRDDARDVWKTGVEPAPFDVFCSRYLGLELRPLQRQIFRDAHLLRARDMIDPARIISTLVVIFGKGSGKDLVIAAWIAWAAFVHCQLKDPFKTWDTGTDTKFAVMNVAPSKALAKEVFFNYLTGHLAKKVFEPLIPNPRAQVGADKITFPQAALTLYSKHSNPKTLEGYSPLFFIIDEGDDFLDNENKSTAQDCYNILASSSATRFGSRGVGLLISYPRTEDGFMERMFKRAENDRTYYRIRASTFQVRPERSPDEPKIASEYQHDPRGARARFECIPMAAVDAFFEYPELIEGCIDPQLRRCASIVPMDTRVETLNNGDTHEYVRLGLENIERKPGCTYFMAGDGGHKKDAFTICIGHIDTGGDAYTWLCPEHAKNPAFTNAADYAPWQGNPKEMLRPPVCGVCGASGLEWGTNVRGWLKKADGQEDTVLINGKAWAIPHVYEDLLLEFRPEKATTQGGRDKTVDWLCAAELCERLMHELGIQVAGFDPWSTVQLNQQLIQATGADVREMKMSNPEQYRRACLAKMVAYQRRLSLLPGNAIALQEWRRLQRKGLSVDHPEGGSKDCYDAQSMMIWLAVNHVCQEIDISWA